MNKLSEKELFDLVQLKRDYDTLVYNIGTISLETEDINIKLSSLLEEKSSYMSTYRIVFQKYEELVKGLTDKYGTGQINLQTGEIS